jgi:hypothetical protein
MRRRRKVYKITIDAKLIVQILASRCEKLVIKTLNCKG